MSTVRQPPKATLRFRKRWASYESDRLSAKRGMRMTLQCPEYIKQAAVAGAPVKFRWSNDIALNLYAAKDQNARLYQAVDLCSFKAQWAIDAALTEWILWRFEGLADLTDGLLRVQAAWAAAIDPAYAKSLAFKLTKGAAIHDTAPV